MDENTALRKKHHVSTIPDHVWHISHRCHKKEFILKFAEDRKRWLHWLFEAMKGFGLEFQRH